ncbi:MAG: hypothetical protein B1H12_04735 [Desulfobacteraceae bacterium 4484_190.2]|nr:MAG: hypothetical protein B1H12_04735 [Desulfobacteraceae bacterium 4484_190.2]
MTPFSFEWQWNVEYIIFFGLLYTALTIIGCGLVYCFIKTWLGLPVAEEHGDRPEISYRAKYSEY